MSWALVTVHGAGDSYEETGKKEGRTDYCQHTTASVCCSSYCRLSGVTLNASATILPVIKLLIQAQCALLLPSLKTDKAVISLMPSPEQHKRNIETQ